MNLTNIIKGIWNYRDYALLLACAVAVYFAVHKPKVINIGNPQSPVQLQQVKQYRDANDKLYAQVTQLSLEKAVTKHYTDSLEKALKVAKGSVKSVDRVVVKDSLVYRDTATQPVYAAGVNTSTAVPIAYSTHYSDAWVQIHAVAGKDTGYINLVDVDTVTRVEVVQKHFFKPTEHLIFLGNSNPHNTINSGAAFTIKERTPNVIILPTIQYSPFSTGSKLSVGISIGLPKFALKF